MSTIVASRYKLLSPVGRGATGVVWRAYDLLLEREVALKEIALPPGPAAADQRRRVVREARMAARLSHRGIVTVHNLTEEGERLWIVMEFLEALTLHDTLVQAGPLPADLVAAMGRKLLDALRHAHDGGVVHRDIKPANIMLTGDRVVLADFGFAAFEGAAGTSLRGTPAFIAPETLQGRGGTREADMWSFGATLYMAVEGRTPFRSVNSMPALVQALREPARPPQRAGALEPVLRGLLRKDPRARLSAEQTSALLAKVRCFSAA
ncbi:serine/threonine-protein kinase [Streptosporangium sp. NPDC051022]|uniref:serine/threonine-protein kinase n=1 Tax=Streptosporangium sp. NPDC051022 TaxID=3155752 RepID=UPI003445FA5E